MRRVRGEREEEAEEPNVMSNYTEHMGMGAVDRADHYCGSYSFTRNTAEMVEEFFFGYWSCVW